MDSHLRNYKRYWEEVNTGAITLVRAVVSSKHKCASVSATSQAKYDINPLVAMFFLENLS